MVVVEGMREGEVVEGMEVVEAVILSTSFHNCFLKFIFTS